MNESRYSQCFRKTTKHKGSQPIWKQLTSAITIKEVYYKLGIIPLENIWDIKIPGMFSGHRTAEVRKKGRVVSANTDNISTLDQPLGNRRVGRLGPLGSLKAIAPLHPPMVRADDEAGGKKIDPKKIYPFCSLVPKIGATQIALLEL